MKFLVLSDLHLEYQAFEPAVPAQAEGVILAGDIANGADGLRWARETFRRLPIVYVPGNHEFYGGEIAETAREMRAVAEKEGIFLLNNTMAVIGGTRFLGAMLWTDFRLYAGDDESELMWAMVAAQRGVPDFDGCIRCYADGCEVAITPRIAAGWHARSRDWLAAELARPYSGRTVVVTHHAPSARSVPPEYAGDALTPAYASDLESLVPRADIWIHGHMHQSCDYRLGDCRVLCNPRGYEAESQAFDPGLLLNV